MLTPASIAALTVIASALGQLHPPASTDSTHSAILPVVRGSENYPVDYPGGTPPADIVGDFDDDDHGYIRVEAGEPCTTQSDEIVTYDTVTLTNTGANTATVSVRLGRMPDPRAACPDNEFKFDPFLSVYEGSFDPEAPLANCLAANDDTNGTDDRCPTLTALPVPPGETRVFVLAVPASLAAESAYGLVFDSTLPVELLEFRID